MLRPALSLQRIHTRTAHDDSRMGPPLAARLHRIGVVRILISNDDGIYSPGIAALAEAASEFGSVRVVAPDVERSSSGHAITASYPLSYRPTRIRDFSAFRVNGTPADCVALGAHLWGSVDLVLSGLNLGFNLGNAIWHSGTLAAAKQAVLLGLRGVALSIPAGADQDLGPFKPWIVRVLQTMLDEPALALVNVNLPRAPRGMLWTNVSVRQYRRAHRAHETSPGTRTLLVYGDAARRCRRRHRPVGRGTALDFADAAEAGFDRRSPVACRDCAPSAGPRARGRDFVPDLVRAGRGRRSRRRSLADRNPVTPGVRRFPLDIQVKQGEK